MRRLVAHTIAQQMSSVVGAATVLSHNALSARAGTECIAHELHLLKEENPRDTVLSMEGIGALDLISRRSYFWFECVTDRHPLVCEKVMM